MVVSRVSDGVWALWATGRAVDGPDVGAWDAVLPPLPRRSRPASPPGATPAPSEGERARPDSLWWLRPEGRVGWALFRASRWVAELGELSTGEWWVRPEGEALPWAETYASRGAAVRAVVAWWLHTHPFAGRA